MTIEEKHELFLTELSSLLYKHEVDLALENYNNGKVVDLCVVSHGISTAIARIKSTEKLKCVYVIL